MCDDGYMKKSETSPDSLRGTTALLQTGREEKEKNLGGGKRDAREQTPGDCVLTAGIVSPITKRLFDIGCPRVQGHGKLSRRKRIRKSH